MRKFRNSLIFSLTFLSILAQSQLLEKRCATAEIEKKQLIKNKNLARARQAFNQSVNNCVQKNRASNAKTSAIHELIRIPVVVHVVYSDASSKANISDEQVKSQIEVLNEDYRRKQNTLGYNTDPIGVDMNIEFYLAEIDPNGANTTGITRNLTAQKAFDPFSDADQLALTALSFWPSDCYLNIWTTTLSNNYLGYSQFPAAPDFDGLDTEANENVDGVYIDYRYFGRKSATITSKYYKFGRTTTHEVGHWLGLIHTWGDEDCGDDYVDDTPAAQNANLTTVCVDKYSNCTGTRSRNMIENYMDYTIDSCMNIFTVGQSERVRAVFEMSPHRKKLLECVTQLPESETLDLTIGVNPPTDILKGQLLLKGTANAEITIFNHVGTLVAQQIFENKKSFQFTFPIYDLPRGLYIVMATANGQKSTKRIFINGN
jgi:Pregnancy-associated plasma protein-A